MKNRKKIGHIVNTFGLKGMIKVSVTCTNPKERFKPKTKIYILNEINDEEEFEINSLIIKNSKTVYIGLNKYNNINDVLYLKDRDIYSDIKLDKDTFFYDDLINLEVLSNDNVSLGKVTNVVEMPKGEYLMINNKILLPFKLDLFIDSINLEDKKIILTPLGLETYNSCNED